MKRTQNAREAGGLANGASRLLRHPNAILLLLLPLWAFVLWDARDAVQPQVPWLDEKAALRRAASMADGEMWDQEGGWLQPPGYPALLALTQAEAPPPTGVFDSAPLVRGWQLAQIAAGFGVAACLLAGGRRLLGPRWGRLPAGLFVLYAEGWVLTLRALPEIWLALASAFVLMEMTRVGSSSQLRRPLAIGLVAGLAVSMRGHAFLLALPLCALFLARREWRRLAAIAVGVLLPIVVLSAAHSWKQGTLVGPSSNGGVNLYIGNRAEANGLYDVDHSYDFARDPAGRDWLRALGADGRGSLAELDGEWRGLAMEEMRRRPTSALALLLRKAWLQFVAMEIPQIDGVEAWRLFTPSLRLFFLPFGLLSAAALVSLVWWRDRPALGAIGGGLLLLVFAQSAFFVTGRFRLIFLPHLCLLGSFVFVQIPVIFSGPHSNRRRVAAILATIATILLVIPWGLGAVRASLREGVATNLGARWSQLIAARYSAGDEMEAFAQLERWARHGQSIALNERSELLYVKLLSERDRHVEAQAQADQLQQRHPESPRVPRARALSYIRGGRLREAEQILRAARGRFPQDEEIRRLWQKVQEDLGS